MKCLLVLLFLEAVVCNQVYWPPVAPDYTWTNPCGGTPPCGCGCCCPSGPNQPQLQPPLLPQPPLRPQPQPTEPSPLPLPTLPPVLPPQPPQPPIHQICVMTEWICPKDPRTISDYDPVPPPPGVYVTFCEYDEHCLDTDNKPHKCCYDSATNTKICKEAVKRLS